MRNTLAGMVRFSGSKIRNHLCFGTPDSPGNHIVAVGVLPEAAFIVASSLVHSIISLATVLFCMGYYATGHTGLFGIENHGFGKLIGLR